MGEYFEMDPEDRKYITGVFTDITNEWGSPCKLYYRGTETTCPNCIINPNTGESTNRYKAGGPEPFELGDICPVCEGRGRIVGTGTSDIIKMIIDWNPKPWMNMSQQGGSDDNIVRIPAGMVTTSGLIEDLPKVLRADNVSLDINNHYISNLYKLSGFPYVLGALTDNKFFFAVWEKVR